jgi:hypothetical protein
MSLSTGTMRGRKRNDLELGVLHDVDDLRDRQAGTLPYLLAEEPVAHAMHVDAKAPRSSLGIGELR